MYPSPSPIRISTITILSYMNFEVDLKQLFYNIGCISSSSNSNGILTLKLHYKEHGKHYLLVKTASETVASEVKNHFQNQLTIIWRFSSREVNSMLFSNGKLKAVGLRDEREVVESLHQLEVYLNQYIEVLYPYLISKEEEKKNIRFENTKCCMINTDFTTHFKIIRDNIYDVIRKEYDIVASYEPDIYPGVKIRYYYNKQSLRNGKCICSVKCKGKGDGDGNGDCKAVTICIFQSGNIIITGGNSFCQIQETYLFINTLLEKSYDTIVYREPRMIMDEHGEYQLLKI